MALELLVGFALDPESALFGTVLLQSWLERGPLTEEQGRLAVRLAALSARGPHALSPDEVAVVTARPSQARSLDPENVATAAKLLAMVGITWAGAGKRAARAGARRPADAGSAERARQAELLAAARAGNVARVAALLQVDFDADRAMHAHFMPDRQTPAGDIAMVRLLLERGATRMNDALRARILATAEAAGDEALAARFRTPPA